MCDGRGIAIHAAASVAYGAGYEIATVTAAGLRSTRLRVDVRGELLGLTRLRGNNMSAALRIGLIGLDTSHAVAFTEILNGRAAVVNGARVTCAFPGGAKDWPISWSRIEGFTAKIKEFGVEVLADLDAVAKKSDLIFITEVDGRMHRDFFEKVARWRKPVFIDKPFATSSQDAERMLVLAGQAGIPLMSCSSLRYAEAFTKALADDAKGAIVGVDVFGPMSLEAAATGLFWYGVHGIEMVVRVMGAGCRTIQAANRDGGEIYTMQWEDGRLATYRGLRNAHSDFGAVIHREKGFQFVDVASGTKPYYASLLAAILKTLPAGRSDVPPAEMLETVRIMETGNKARLTPGAAVTV